MKTKRTKTMLVALASILLGTSSFSQTFNVLIDEGPGNYNMRGEQVHWDPFYSHFRVFGDFKDGNGAENSHALLEDDGIFKTARTYTSNNWDQDFVYFGLDAGWGVSNVVPKAPLLPDNAIMLWQIDNTEPDLMRYYISPQVVGDAVDYNQELYLAGNTVSGVTEVTFSYFDQVSHELNAVSYAGLDVGIGNEGPYITEDGNGNFVMVFNNVAPLETHILKVEADGTPLWSRKFSSTLFELTPHDIILNHDNTITIVGGVNSSQTGDEGFLINLSNDGNTINLQTRFSAPSTAKTEIYGVKETSDLPGVYGYILAGKTGGGTVPFKGLMVKMDNYGNVYWSNSDPSDVNGLLYDCLEVSNGYVFTGTDYDYAGGTKVIRTDNFGNVSNCSFTSLTTTSGLLGMTITTNSIPTTTIHSLVGNTAGGANELVGLLNSTPGANWSDDCGSTSGCNLSLIATWTDELCFGEGGKLIINPAGSYDFAINGGAFASGTNPLILPVGEYTILVKDPATGCIVELTGEILPGPPPMHIMGCVTHLHEPCDFSLDGEIELTITNGTEPYTVTNLLDPNGPVNNPSPNVWIFENLGAGTYEFQIIDANGCERLIIVHVYCLEPGEAIISPCDVTPNKRSPAEADQAKHVEVYPVPASDFVVFRLPFELKTGSSYEIYDISGKLMVSKSLSNKQGAFNFEIDTRSLSTGTYIFSLKNGTQSVRKLLSIQQ